MPPGNRGGPGKDQDGKPDGSWWGTNINDRDDGGQHITHYGDDGSRASYDTDRDGYYVEGSGHTVDSDGNIDSWDD